MDDPARSMLRHALATLSYRAGKTLRGAPAGFATYRLHPSLRTPVEILAHMGDLMEWALSLARGPQRWHPAAPLPWDEEVARFFRVLGALDACLASHATLDAPVERLLQGPVADALTHTGQLGILRRPAGAPVGDENYFRADIAAGRIGLDPPSA